MRKLIYLLSYLMFMAITSQAQHDHSRCGHTHIDAFNQIHHPLFSQKTDEIERFTQQWIASNPQHARSGTVLKIPVVIHVVWNDPVENISDAQIQTQLDVLNEDFRKRNADTTFIPGVFQPLAADVGIEFVLAQRDTLGAPTTGINRIQTTIDEFGSFNSAALPTVPLWDTTSYLNIYVCEISNGGHILGYATLPGMPFNGFDGIVMDYRYFGTIGTVQAPFHLGRTLTHEVGHYLNLLHTWGSNGGGCNDDDLVNDTPNQEYPNYGCNTHPLNSCNSADMFMNYMDYGDDPCLVMFTQGQKMRMLAALNGPRASLLTSNALIPLPSTIYVNAAATGVNNGTSWADAYTDLSDALTVAVTESEIWVAQGMYIPGGTAPTRSSTFNVPDSIKIYGGFDGTETELNQRNPETNITILTGDINGDDIDGDLNTNKTDNTLHVMWVEASVGQAITIDGFTIKGGHADVTNLFDETTRIGGGILSYGTPFIKNCTFEDNYALEGGAINFKNTTNVEIEDCSFLNNASNTAGGAVIASGIDMTYKHCYFKGNEAPFSGGALDITDGSIDIVDCTFESNKSALGGAISIIFSNTTAISKFTNSNFIHNNVTEEGGAIYTEGISIDIMSCVFERNSAGQRGGAIKLEEGDHSITNSLIANNTARGFGRGGAIYTKALSPTELTIINSTIANNRGASVDGIYQSNSGLSTLYLGNTILSHANGNYRADSLHLATIISSQGNLSNDSTLAHILTHISDKNGIDPKFADTINYDYHLQQGSPAQDIGITANAPLYDLDSLSRIGFSDAGAYEYPFFVSTEKPTISLTNDVKVYPNPPVDILTIEINNNWLGTVNFQLMDISGKIIKTWNTEKQGELHQEQLSTQNLASGMYQVLLASEAGVHVVRFIKL